MIEAKNWSLQWWFFPGILTTPGTCSQDYKEFEGWNITTPGTCSQDFKEFEGWNMTTPRTCSQDFKELEGWNMTTPGTCSHVFFQIGIKCWRWKNLALKTSSRSDLNFSFRKSFSEKVMIGAKNWSLQWWFFSGILTTPGTFSHVWNPKLQKFITSWGVQWILHDYNDAF